MGLTICASRKQVRPSEGNWVTVFCTRRAETIAKYEVRTTKEYSCVTNTEGRRYWWRADVISEGRAPWVSTRPS
jgi:hypothetical protein